MMIHFLSIGVILGLSAGFMPGPLLTLVISETLQHNTKAGVKVALAPVITDFPIVVLTLFVLAKLANFHGILGGLSLIGGFVILLMGYKSIRIKGVELNFQNTKPKSLAKGVLVNILSPHPYLFWFGVGGPIMTKAMNQTIIAPLVFILSFYFCLVGSKVLLAILTGKSKSFLSGNIYIFIMRFLGLVLCVLALILFYDGLKLLGIITI
jgi:threonine/homoserine/homoserine lactone efflux protein